MLPSWAAAGGVWRANGLWLGRIGEGGEGNAGSEGPCERSARFGDVLYAPEMGAVETSYFEGLAALLASVEGSGLTPTLPTTSGWGALLPDIQDSASPRL